MTETTQTLPDQVAEVETDPLVRAVDTAREAHEVAARAATAARQALADAEAAVAAYEQRVQAGDLPVTPGTLASKRDSVELARLALGPAEQREAAALARVREAVVAQTIRQVTEDPRLAGGVLLNAQAKARKLFNEAVAVLTAAAEERNAGIREAADALAGVGAPVARRHNFAATELGDESSPVHLLTGSGDRGVLVGADRELMPNNSRRWAEREIARIVKANLPPQVRKDIV